MSMQDEMMYVIKKGEYYVNAKFKALFSGVTTGFTGYINEKTMKKDLERLGKGYYCEYINLKDIPNGERIWLD